MTEVQIYTRETIGSLDWPDTPDGKYAQSYLLPFFQNDPSTYISNIHNTTLMLAKIGEVLLPISISDFHPQNTYTVSPYSHYVTYGGFEEIERLGNPAAEAVIRAILRPIGWWFRRAEFDRVVYINNWLLSTNLYPALQAEQIEALAWMLPSLFPDRPVIFRSLDRYRKLHLIDALERCGYRMVVSRQVWYIDPEAARQKKQFKVDMSVFKKSQYEIVDGKALTDAEIDRAVELYNLLYIQKYSHFNPQFTPAFIRLARDCDLLTLRMLRLDGRFDAVMGYFVRNGVMTQPFFGYDTTLPQKIGLYRLLTMVTLLEGMEHGLMVHASAGVGPFKKLRGGMPVIEYNAVYDRHLPLGRRLPWSVLKVLSDKIAIPVFQKYGF